MVEVTEKTPMLPTAPDMLTSLASHYVTNRFKISLYSLDEHSLEKLKKEVQRIKLAQVLGVTDSQEIVNFADRKSVV